MVFVLQIPESLSTRSLNAVYSNSVRFLLLLGVDLVGVNIVRNELDAFRAVLTSSVNQLASSLRPIIAQPIILTKNGAVEKDIRLP